MVGLALSITRWRHGRRLATTLVERQLRFESAGTRRVLLPLGPRGRAALAAGGQARLTLTGRHRSPGGRITLGRASRLLRGRAPHRPPRAPRAPHGGDRD